MQAHDKNNSPCFLSIELPSYQKVQCSPFSIRILQSGFKLLDGRKMQEIRATRPIASSAAEWCDLILLCCNIQFHLSSLIALLNRQKKRIITWKLKSFFAGFGGVLYLSTNCLALEIKIGVGSYYLVSKSQSMGLLVHSHLEKKHFISRYCGNKLALHTTVCRDVVCINIAELWKISSL